MAVNFATYTRVYTVDSVANRSMQWYHKGGMYSRVVENECHITILQGQG